MTINTEIINGTTYYTTSARGVNYTLFHNGTDWTLISNRNSRRGRGTVRDFTSLEEIENTIKAFRGVSVLL